MMTYRLILPDLTIKEQFMEFVNEWKDEVLVPISCDLNGMSYEKWLQKNISYRYETYVPSFMVSATTFLLVDENNYIYGAIDFRHRLNDTLLMLGGHIGYGIRPSQRGKGLAKIMLGLLLNVIKKHGYQKVLISCLKSNEPSRKTILAQGGVLENEITYKNEVYQRYWIYLK